MSAGTPPRRPPPPPREDIFQGAHGTPIFCQWWKPADEIKSALAIVHGWGEHSGRYGSIADFFVADGVLVGGFDLRGHGHSPGQRGYVRRWDDFVNDALAFSACLSRLASGAPFFLLGHSLGAVIALDAALRAPYRYDGLLLSAPALSLRAIPPSQWLVAHLFDRVLPRFSLQVMKDVKTRPEEPPETLEDPLLHSRGTARLGMEIRRAITRLTPTFSSLKVPTLILHSKDDPVASIDGSRRLAQSAGSSVAELVEFDGDGHEVFLDATGDAALRAAGDWVRRRRQEVLQKRARQS